MEALPGFESRFVSDMAFYQGQLYLSTDQGVYALSSWPFRSVRIDLIPDFPALMAPSDSSLFFLSASGQLLDLEGNEHSGVFPTNETVLDLPMHRFEDLLPRRKKASGTFAAASGKN